jgi:hypothetical protein
MDLSDRRLGPDLNKGGSPAGYLSIDVVPDFGALAQGLRSVAFAPQGQGGCAARIRLADDGHPRLYRSV